MITVGDHEVMGAATRVWALPFSCCAGTILMHRHIQLYLHAHIHTYTHHTCLLYISSSVGVECFPLNELPFGFSVHSRAHVWLGAFL